MADYSPGSSYSDEDDVPGLVDQPGFGNRANDAMGTHAPLIVFDFDGILVRPYTDPEEFFPNALETLRTLTFDCNCRVAVVSSNPRAYHVMARYLDVPHLERGYVAALRARSTEKWWLDGGTYSDEKHGATNHKGQMIASIVAELEGRGKFVDRLLVVEDKAEKLAEVYETFPNASGKPGTGAPVHCFKSVVGLVMPSLEGTLDPFTLYHIADPNGDKADVIFM